jgi:linoleoyl-CoA desaturase
MDLAGPPRYPTRSVPPTFLGSTAFRHDLHARVEAYFEEKRLSQRDAWAMYLKTAVLMLWLSASYAGLVFWAANVWQALPLAVSLGLAMAGVGFNIQHDGGHGAYSRHRAINKTMALTLNLLGGNAYFWHYKHNIAHHTYSNIAGSDDDLNVGPFGRFSPHDRRYAFHRFQHLYVWALYAFLAIEWQLSGDFRSFVNPGIADTRVPRPCGWEHLTFWAGKLVFFALAFGVPLYLHSVHAVVLLYLLTGFVLGLTLATVFQLAHCVEEAAFRQPAKASGQIGQEWTAHQVETAVDFARGNRLLTWYLGGLNFQIEHHLFPKICHVHYPALSPIVERTCAAHGVRHFSYPTARAALRSHVRLLKRLGAKESLSADVHADAGADVARQTVGEHAAPSY